MSHIIYQTQIRLINKNVLYGYNFCLHVVAEGTAYRYFVSYKGNNQYSTGVQSYEGKTSHDTPEKALIDGIDFCLSGAIFKGTGRNGFSIITKQLRTRRERELHKQTELSFY